MTGLNHGITGALIALTVKQPALAVPASFVSHFVCDAIPHWDYYSGENQKNLFSRKFNAILVVDFLLSIGLMVIMAIMFPSQKWLIWGCMIAAAIPDVMWFYYKFYIERIKKKKSRLDPITLIQHNLENSSPNGYWIEVIWFTLVAFIIIKLQ